MKKNFFRGIFLASTLFGGVGSVYAEEVSGDGASKALELLGKVNAGVRKDFDVWVTGALNWAIGIAALVSVAVLIGAGYSYISANGDESKIQNATKSLTWAIVGLVICFVASIIVQFVVKGILGGSEAPAS